MTRPATAATLPPLALTIIALLLALPACTGRGPVMDQPWDFTTDGLEATTDAAAALADGSTQATKELLGPLKGMVSSMAPGGDGRVSEDVRIVAFVVANHERLQTDIARGGGEHLTAFSHVLGVPAAHRARFTGTLHDQYGSIYDAALTPLQSLDRLLAMHYRSDWREILTAPSP